MRCRAESGGDYGALARNNDKAGGLIQEQSTNTIADTMVEN